MVFVEACVLYLITTFSPKVTPFLPISCIFDEQTRRNPSQDYTHTLIMRVFGVQKGVKKTLGVVQDTRITDDQEPVIVEAINQIMAQVAQQRIFHINYILTKNKTDPHIFTIIWSEVRLAAIAEEKRQQEGKKDGRQHRSTAA